MTEQQIEKESAGYREPCPFCGSEPWGIFGPRDQSGEYWVECHGHNALCGDWYYEPDTPNGDIKAGREATREAWNRRATASHEPASLTDLAAEVWAMAQGPQPIEDAAALIAKAISAHIASQPTIRDVRIVESQPAAEWLPIKSAPMNGKSILVFEPGTRGGVYVAHWLNWPLDRMRTGWIGNGHILRPSHWMPIPVPPSAEQAATKEQP